MFYKSTRGSDHGKTFEEVLVSTYASDGGLYVPEDLPMITFDQLCTWANYSFPQVCAEVMSIFTGIDVDILSSMTEKAFCFFNDGIIHLPMTKYNEIILLDTSLGPTYSFKDIGQQMVAQLLNYYLSKKNKKAKIVVETSGDTGPAAIYGVKGCSNIDIFCLYPKNRVSIIQELQMITIPDKNVHVYRTDGDTDEQASILKELFRNKEFIQEHSICSINSINWARIAIQSTYYIYSYLQINNTKELIGNTINYCIPTGAFGNAMGGYLAKQMGLPIGKIICATNTNDIVYRTITTGDLRMGLNVAVSHYNSSVLLF